VKTKGLTCKKGLGHNLYFSNTVFANRGRDVWWEMTILFSDEEM
jgi:hypothetical protein